MNIYYYFPLKFHFNSGQTIQILRDYKYLSHLGYSIFLYGTYDDPSAFQEVLDYIGQDPIHLLAMQGNSRWNRNLLKMRFLAKIFMDRKQKLVLSRNYNKMSEVITFKGLLGKTLFALELHEDALPYMCKKNLEADKMRHRFACLFKKLDFLILTNYSQEVILKEQFHVLPECIVLPNGVAFEDFHHVEPPQEPHKPIFITYAGQFTAWKNIELLFQALALLPDRYRLRIAGGKNDQASQSLIHDFAVRYGLNQRVDFCGFVQPRQLVDSVFQGSSVFVLPLGDNMESRYFTSPMKLIEYMATKVPVIAVDYPSVHMLTGSDTVFLSRNDPKAFADAIIAATTQTDSARIKKMNAIAYEHRYENRSLKYHQMIIKQASCS